MPRGAAKEAKQQLQTTNKAAAGAGANAANIYGSLQPQAQALTQSTGFDPATLSAISNAGMGGVNAAFGDAGDKLQRSVARTGNPAGIGGQLDALARSKGIAGGEEAGKIQIANANEKTARRSEGLNLLNSLYGQNLGQEASLYGMAPATINAQTNASPGWVQSMSQVLSSINGAGYKGSGGSSVTV